MRFTNWPALINALVIFTITLSSLIPAANAISPVADKVADVKFVIPEDGQTYVAGDESGMTWDIIMNANFSDDVLFNSTCNLYLTRMDFTNKTGGKYTLATGVRLLEEFSSLPNPSSIRYPPNSAIGYGYFIILESEDIGIWRSGIFSLKSPDP